MHILVVPSWYRSSKTDTQGSFFREQALSLSRHGCKVGIIHPQHRSMRQWRSLVTGRYGFTSENDTGIPTLRLHTMTWFPRQIPQLNALLWVRSGLSLYRRYVSKYGKPDIIHAHAMMYGGILAYKIQQRDRIPFVITEHGTAYRRGLFAPWEIRLAARAAACANRRFAVSQAFCDEMAGFLGGHWHPLPNVVSSPFTDYPLPDKTDRERGAKEKAIKEKPAKEKAAKEKAVKESPCKGEQAYQPFTFITIAYLTNKRKGIHNLVKAFAAQFKGDASTHLKIGGEGKERRYLEKLVSELGIANQVTFLGALTRQAVLEQVASADSLVLASEYETFGVVVIEALALGKPVVATRCGGPDLVVREQDGLLIPPRDVGALAKALTAIRENIDSYDPQEIRSACVARFGEQAIATQLKAAYASVIAAGQATSPPSRALPKAQTNKAQTKETTEAQKCAS